METEIKWLCPYCGSMNGSKIGTVYNVTCSECLETMDADKVTMYPLDKGTCPYCLGTNVCIDMTGTGGGYACDCLDCEAVFSHGLCTKVYNLGLSEEIKQAIKDESLAINEYGHLVFTEDGSDVTDPYGHLSYTCGNEDEFVAFDYHMFGKFAVLHSVVNSELGGFLDTFHYRVVGLDAAPNVAEVMWDAAIDWCNDNQVRKVRYARDRQRFLRAVRGGLK